MDEALTLTRLLADEDATVALARQLAARLDGGLVVWLQGELGAGKTAFARGLLQALGVAGRVKSPTYTLIEPYRLGDGRPAWHLDLYRIADATELEWLGVDELGDPAAVVLVEWPERGAAALPAADITLALSTRGSGREARLGACTPRGAALLASLPGGQPGEPPASSSDA